MQKSWRCLQKDTFSAGDSQIELDNLSTDALQPNDNLLEDAFGRILDMGLPTLDSGLSLTDSEAISISDSWPLITGIAAGLILP